MDATHSGFTLHLRNSKFVESITFVRSKQVYSSSQRDILAHTLKLFTVKTTQNNVPNKKWPGLHSCLTHQDVGGGEVQGECVPQLRS